MGIVTANELKTRGVAAIEEAVSATGEAILSVRGERRYVTVSVEDYMRLRSCELEAALREVESDLAEGKFVVEDAEEHVRRLDTLE